MTFFGHDKYVFSLSCVGHLKINQNRAKCLTLNGLEPQILWAWWEIPARHIFVWSWGVFMQHINGEKWKLEAREEPKHCIFNNACENITNIILLTINLTCIMNLLPLFVVAVVATGAAAAAAVGNHLISSESRHVEITCSCPIWITHMPTYHYHGVDKCAHSNHMGKQYWSYCVWHLYLVYSCCNIDSIVPLQVMSTIRKSMARVLSSRISSCTNERMR